ncbi:MAG: TIGR03546 family protein [Bdellovibrio sp.]|nr:TIGR03546 family protein [Bdellovibrio sp.]
MTLMLKQIFAFIKLLNSETGTNQIAAGVALGFILGMAPGFSLQTILVLLLALFFRVQFGAAGLSAFFFKFIAWLFDPLFDRFGRVILDMDSLHSTLTWAYNLPIVPFTKFYNSVVMGSGVLSILLFPLVFLLTRMLVLKYRELIVAKIKDTKLWKALKATSLFQWYEKYDRLY